MTLNYIIGTTRTCSFIRRQGSPIHCRRLFGLPTFWQPIKRTVCHIIRGFELVAINDWQQTTFSAWRGALTLLHAKCAVARLWACATQSRTSSSRPVATLTLSTRSAFNVTLPCPTSSSKRIRTGSSFRPSTSKRTLRFTLHFSS